MDNDDKVRQLITPGEILPEFSSSNDNKVPKLYDLAAEFTATKKNRNYFSVIVIVTFVIVMTVVSLIITGYIEKNNRKLKIDISDFEDVNLVDLLNATRKFENDLNLVTVEISGINERMNAEIEMIKNESDAKVDALLGNDTTVKEKSAAGKKIRNDERIKINQIREKYKTLLSEKAVEKDLILAKIESYDMRQLEKAKKNEEMLQSQKRLHELEMKKIVTGYENQLATEKLGYENNLSRMTRVHKAAINELKRKHTGELESLTLLYNPLLTDQTADMIAGSSPESGVPLAGITAGITALSNKDQGISGKIQKVEKSAEEFDYAAGLLAKIPYINSVPGLIRGITGRAAILVSELTGINNDLTVQVNRQKVQIERDTAIKSNYEKSLRHYLRISGDTGVILNAEDPGKVHIYANDLFPLKNGMTIKIFRSDDEYIGNISLYKQDGNFYGKIDQVKPGKKIEPFDRLFLDLKSGTESDDMTGDSGELINDR